MLRSWRLQGLGETCLIAPRSLVSREEEGDYLSSQLDRWLADPLSRKMVLEIYESVRGQSGLPAKRLQGQELHKYVKSEILQAFRHGQFVLMRMPHLTILPNLELSHSKEEAVGEEPPPAKESPTQKKTWVGIELVDQKERPVPNARYVLELPDGKKRSGRLDENGRLQALDLDPGTCKVWFPDFDASEWQGGTEVADQASDVPPSGAREEPSPSEPASAQASSASVTPASEPPTPTGEKSWVDLELVDEEGNPVPNARYKLCMADGTEREGVLGDDGRRREESLHPGVVKITFPDFDATEWDAA